MRVECDDCHRNLIDCNCDLFKTKTKETIDRGRMSKNYLFEHSHEGVACLSCGQVLISYYRHSYKTCGCSQQTMIDGGQEDYVRYGGKDLSLVRQVLITPILHTKAGKVSKKKILTFREFAKAQRKGK